MKCNRCGIELEPGEEREHRDQVICEDCYMDALSPIRTCDPLFLKRNRYDAKEKKLRLLDTENLEVQTYSLELLGEEELNLAGKTFHCRIVRIKGPKKDIRYWIAEDEISAFLVKEQGKDEGVAYSITLKSYHLNAEQ